MAEVIWVLVDDLFFLAKIQQTAKLLGLSIRIADPTKLRDELAGGPPTAVIIDLNHRSGAALEAVRTIRAGITSTTPVVGFLSHVQADLSRAAREAGCDSVLARSAFSEQLPKILSRLSAGERLPI